MLLRNLRFVCVSTLFWIFAISFYIFVRYFRVYFEYNVKTEFDFNYSFNDYLLYSGVLVGLIFGILYSIVWLLINKKLIKRFSNWQVIVFESIVFFWVFAFAQWTNLYLFDLGLNTFYVRGQSFLSVFSHDFFWTKISYTIIVSVVLSLIRISVENFGQGRFCDLLLGKYRVPKEEERIFMFLDMKSSTRIAEQLGHHKFCELVQDCFVDLSFAVRKNDAQIDKYIGDEIVLTWTVNKGLKNNHCVQLFFDFTNSLLSRKDYYEKKFGVFPLFKAGAHMGKVMITEIGVIKKELTFLGDTMNTAAKIQEMCNQFDQKLIFSEQLFSRLQKSKDLKAQNLGLQKISGREEGLTLIGLA